MDQKFFRVPFANSGEISSVPDAMNTEGYVSFEEGWTPDYRKDPNVHAEAKPVPLAENNYLLNAITGAIRQYQTHGIPEWITAADNNESAFAYDAGVIVMYSGVPYLSLIANNTATPGADENAWQVYIQREASEEEAIIGEGATQAMTPRRVKQSAAYLDAQLAESIEARFDVSGVPVGAITTWGTAIPPSGWLECNGQSFDMSSNPELAALFPSGTVPNYRGRFIKHGAEGDTIGSLLANNIHDHYHFMGRFHGDSGGWGDDVSFVVRDQVWNAGDFAGRGLYGDYENAINTTFPHAGGLGQIIGTTNGVDTSGGDTVVNPAHAIAIYIIKTDQAVAEEGEAAPTAIVVSPATVTLQAGSAQQFTGTVLPASIAGNFPVSWAVSDSSLGSVSASGLYTASAGVSGTQTVIASISTGLTATATVTQHIFLTSITIGTIPTGLLSGSSYDVAITYAPANYSENVVASSSDSSVATLTSGGTLTINGAGTATLSLTGANSGVTASVTITATEAVVPEVYLQIANNLSEIAEAGEGAQEASRDNLGLGQLATQDDLSAGDVGAVPLADASIASGVDLDTLTQAGQYFQNVSSYATAALNYPAVIAGALIVYATGVDNGGCRQVYMPYNSTVEYRRYAYGVPLVFSDWTEY